MSKVIMVVEDSGSFRMVVKLALQKAGYTVIEAVDGKDAVSKPVIMLTTESQESKKAEGKAAGARAWITKPFQPSQLVDAVNRLCV
jgi:two-component system chemotaxis response regulator CheY